jgi:hypothetical protein
MKPPKCEHEWHYVEAAETIWCPKCKHMERAEEVQALPPGEFMTNVNQKLRPGAQFSKKQNSQLN